MKWKGRKEYFKILIRDLSATSRNYFEKITRGAKMYVKYVYGCYSQSYLW